MANPDHLNIIRQGVDVWNKWREENYGIEPDLAQADLHGSEFKEANLSRADLKRANFRNALVARSYFCDLDLSLAKGLHSIIHFGPSTIGIDTIQRSKGHISESFLHGAGVPPTFVDYTASLAENDFNNYSSFISYVDEDWDFAEKLHNDLDCNGGHCWFMPEEQKIGDKIQHNMEQSIRIHDKLVLVLSQHSVSRPWVEKEVENAFEEEIKKKKTLLIPVRIDTEVMDSDRPWAGDLRRSRHIADFTNWSDPESYTKAFDRMLHLLKT